MNAIASAPKCGAGQRHLPEGVCKDIAVHLDGSTEDDVRLAHAEALAARFRARMTGIFTNLLPDPALYAEDFAALAMSDLIDGITEKGDITERRLRERFARLDPLHELRRIEAFPGSLEEAVATEVRWNDLFVATCPRDEGNQRWCAVIESAMFEGGRGLLLIPPGAPLRSVIRTVLVGWVDARQSARAAAEALPFLRQATRVHIVMVREEAHGRMGGAEVLADITAHLARHGVEATADVPSTQGSPAEGLLAEARRISADLIVAGAYGHSRFREWVLGGVTQRLLATSPLPLLMAH